MGKTRLEINNELHSLFGALSELKQRATGRTTRIIDYAIQCLFETPDEWIEVHDHWDTRQASKMLVDGIKRRLSIEHHLELEVRSLADNYFAIRLKNYHKPDTTQEQERIKQDIETLQMELEKLKSNKKYEFN